MLEPTTSNLTTPPLTPHKVTTQLTGLLHQRYSIWVLGVISFVESALPVPLITDPFMVAYMLAHRSKIILALLVTTGASIIGGLAAYFVTAFFSEAILSLASPETIEQFNQLALQYADSSFLLAFLGAITPVPFTLAAMVAGAMQGNVFLFILGAFVGRIIRYGITGYLVHCFGAAALSIAQRNIKPITIAAIIFAILYIWFVL